MTGGGPARAQGRVSLAAAAGANGLAPGGLAAAGAVPVGVDVPAGRDGPGPDVPERQPAQRYRIDADPESVERGLVSLVLTVVELLRQLMERQALRRVDDGTLSDEQVEKIGCTLMALEERMGELTEHFGLSHEDLNLDLGPLGPLLPYE